MQIYIFPWHFVLTAIFYGRADGMGKSFMSREFDFFIFANIFKNTYFAHRCHKGPRCSIGLYSLKVKNRLGGYFIIEKFSIHLFAKF